jgi:hypothetical protein
MTDLATLIPSPAAREFLKIIDAERGRNVALWFVEAMVEGRWVYAGKSEALPEIEIQMPHTPAVPATSRVESSRQGRLL